jgi:Zn-dependent protease
VNIDIIYIIIVIAVVLVSMTFHEAMHAFTSYWLGDDTAKLHGRLSFNPIKHIDPFLTILLPIMLAVVGAPIFGGAKPVPFNPQNVRWGEWGAALVALAGPLTNFLIAFLAFGIWVLAGLPNQGILGQIFGAAVSVNLGFFIFNMIPIPPLDGSRVLYALAPEFVRRGMEAMEQFGIIIVFAIILFAGSAFETFFTGAISFFLNLFGHIFGL